MPRAARVTCENSCYHIITRGNQRQTVFLDISDYQIYLKMLAKRKNRFGFKLYSFCLMPNHVHLLMKTEKASALSSIMRSLNLSYTLYFNFKYQKVGHLWQDRFKSKIIERDDYLLECMKYIEENPLRASLVKRIDEYNWSSYKFRSEENKFLDNLF